MNRSSRLFVIRDPRPLEHRTAHNLLSAGRTEIQHIVSSDTMPSFFRVFPTKSRDNTRAFDFFAEPICNAFSTLGGQFKNYYIMSQRNIIIYIFRVPIILAQYTFNIYSTICESDNRMAKREISMIYRRPRPNRRVLDSS